MCHHIEDGTFDVTAQAVNPKARIRHVHRPPRSPGDRAPHCRWEVVIDDDTETLPEAEITKITRLTTAADVRVPADEGRDAARARRRQPAGRRPRGAPGRPVGAGEGRRRRRTGHLTGRPSAELVETPRRRATSRQPRSSTGSWRPRPTRSRSTRTTRSPSAIAKRAGVSPATAYTYFSSKDHVLAEVLWRRTQPAAAAGRPQPTGRRAGGRRRPAPRARHRRQPGRRRRVHDRAARRLAGRRADPRADRRGDPPPAAGRARARRRSGDAPGARDDVHRRDASKPGSATSTSASCLSGCRSD